MQPINALRMRNPSALGEDPYWSNVVLLTHFDGSDGSTTFTDEKGHTLTPVGSAQLDTAQSKFGGSSLLLAGSGNNVDIADSNDWNFSDGQFTVETFFRLNSAPANWCILSQWGATPSDAAWALFYSGGQLIFRYYWANVGTDFTSVAYTWTPTLSTWHHVAVDRGASENFRLYLDGVMVAKVHELVHRTINNGTAALSFGKVNGFSFPFDGWIDETRITKGVGRYASDSGFTVPAAAYPNS